MATRTSLPRTLHLLPLLLAAVAPAPAAAQSSADSAVLAVIERYHVALAAADTAAVERLLASDAIILESGGIETRAEYLQHHLPGDIAFAAAVPRQRGDVRVVVLGDVAWATSSSTTRGEFRGRTVNSSSAELMVLRRVAGEWKIAAIHWSSRALRS
jgi:ketosteroid isomerase-like protein